MVKPDKQQQKISFESKKAPKPTEQMADGEVSTDLAPSNNMEKILLSIQANLQDINGKLDNLTCRMDGMSDKLEKHGERLETAETRISTVEDESRTTTNKCAGMERMLEVIKAKEEELEAQSRRNNVRITGLPETTNTGRMEVYIEQLCKDLFGADALSPIFIVERAHRSLAPRPPPGAPPRPLVVRILNYRDRDTILRLAREKGTITHQSNTLEFYPDHTVAVQQARKEFASVKAKLRDLNISYSM